MYISGLMAFIAMCAWVTAYVYWPKLAVADGALGFWNALSTVYPDTTKVKESLQEI